MAQPAARKAASTEAARAMSSGWPTRTSSHSARGRPAEGNAPAPPIEMSKGRPVPAADAGRLGRCSDPILERRAQEAERQVEAVEADPSDVTAAARDAIGANLLDERGDLRLGLGRERAPR